jgi:hypothetical protein
MDLMKVEDIGGRHCQGGVLGLPWLTLFFLVAGCVAADIGARAEEPGLTSRTPADCFQRLLKH